MSWPIRVSPTWAMDGQLIVMEIRRPRRLALLDDVPWYVWLSAVSVALPVQRGACGRSCWVHSSGSTSRLWEILNGLHLPAEVVSGCLRALVCQLLERGEWHEMRFTGVQLEAAELWLPALGPSLLLFVHLRLLYLKLLTGPVQSWRVSWDCGSDLWVESGERRVNTLEHTGGQRTNCLRVSSNQCLGTVSLLNGLSHAAARHAQ